MCSERSSAEEFQKETTFCLPVINIGGHFKVRKQEALVYLALTKSRKLFAFGDWSVGTSRPREDKYTYEKQRVGRERHVLLSDARNRLLYKQLLRHMLHKYMQTALTDIRAYKSLCTYRQRTDALVVVALSL